MAAQTTADLRREAELGAEQSLELANAGDHDGAIYLAWLSMIIFGAADVLDRRAAGLPSFAKEIA